MLPNASRAQKVLEDKSSAVEGTLQNNTKQELNFGNENTRQYLSCDMRARLLYQRFPFIYCFVFISFFCLVLLWLIRTSHFDFDSIKSFNLVQSHDPLLLWFRLGTEMRTTN